MKIIGLTGSIAMGKSTAAKIFAENGIAVHDSDAAVHAFYSCDAARLLAPHFPDAIVDHAIDRTRLSAYVLNDSANMRILESIVHPFVERNRETFLDNRRRSGERLSVVDIPLLFEIGAEGSVDVVAVVSASEQTQRRRALLRANMTPEKFEAIKAKQIPDSEKTARAHFVISSEFGLEHTRNQIVSLLRTMS